METGTVKLSENTTAPAVKIMDLDGDRVLLYVYLPTEPIKYEATRGDQLAVGVFVSDE